MVPIASLEKLKGLLFSISFIIEEKVYGIRCQKTI